MAERAEEVRDRQRADWNAAAEGWVADREVIFETTPITQRLIDMAHISQGFSVLDMASGSGDPAFAVARIVGPRGRVLALDIAAAMIAAGRSLLRELELDNVEFRTIEDECAPALDAGTFDAITCRFGLMFMADPSAAARAWRPALRRGGRIAVSTWESMPFADFVREIIARHAPVREAPSRAPGILAVSDPAQLGDVLRAAGFSDITVAKQRTAVFGEHPPEAWWDSMAQSAGPFVRLLGTLPDATRAAIRADGIRALYERHPSGVVVEYGDALVAAAVNPG